MRCVLFSGSCTLLLVGPLAAQNQAARRLAARRRAAHRAASPAMLIAREPAMPLPLGRDVDENELLARWTLRVA
jgi:hypothetical protein